MFVVHHKTSHLVVCGWKPEHFPSAEGQAAVIESAIAQAGGTSNDWEVLEIGEALWEARNPLADQFAASFNGAIITGLTAGTPPTLSLSAATVSVSGGSVTVNGSVVDAGYTGKMYLKIRPPGNGQQVFEFDAVAGAFSDSISTPILGLHEVELYVLGFGLALDELTGV